MSSPSMPLDHNEKGSSAELTSTLHIAIVGCGQIVTHHLKAIANQLGTGKIVVRALVDPSAQSRGRTRSMAQSYGLLHPDKVPEFNLLSEFLQDHETSSDCRVAFIAVPHDLHQELTLQALQGDKIVVLEKPLAPTIESCKILIEASQTTSSMLIVAEQSPYWEEVSLAKQLIDKGSIGTILTASSYYYESMRDNVTSGSVDNDGGLGWRGSIRRAGGGIVIDGGLHWIRPLREMVGGPITDVVGVIQAGLQPQLNMEGESLAHAILKIRSNNKTCNTLTATYSANMLATAPMAHDTCPYFRVTGTKGELVIAGDGLFPNGGGGLRLYNSEFPNGHDMLPPDRQGGFFLGFGHLWVEIYRIIAQQDRDAAHRSVTDAAADVSVALALYKSSSSGHWEKTAFE